LRTRAAILVEQRKPLVVDEVELPEAGFGQVQVRILVSGVCGSQLGEIDGVKGPDPWLPHLLGHEACGVVEAVGPFVSTVAPGDRVVLHWRPGSGIEAPTPRYAWGSRRVNAGRVTTFQERAIVSENRVTAVPHDLEPEAAVLYGCALTTGFGVVCNDARVRIGESVVVLGCGGSAACWPRSWPAPIPSSPSTSGTASSSWRAATAPATSWERTRTISTTACGRSWGTRGATW
jgi:S-(hydroxymethyl)glutathione dehydrogenase/alcohol dehydrogenase